MGVSRLSKAVLSLIAAGAGASVIATQLAGESEGIRLRAYQDGARVWTICNGHTAGVNPGQAVTQAQCNAFLKTDMGHAFAALGRTVKVPMSEPERAGLADWVFNVGEPAARKSTLIRKLNAGDKIGACAELSRWVIVGDKDCRKAASNCTGIVTRREQERELCLM